MKHRQPFSSGNPASSLFPAPAPGSGIQAKKAQCPKGEGLIALLCFGGLKQNRKLKNSNISQCSSWKTFAIKEENNKLKVYTQYYVRNKYDISDEQITKQKRSFT